jgi:DMSO reductase anchor subunit
MAEFGPQYCSASFSVWSVIQIVKFKVPLAKMVYHIVMKKKNEAQKSYLICILGTIEDGIVKV